MKCLYCVLAILLLFLILPVATFPMEESHAEIPLRMRRQLYPYGYYPYGYNPYGFGYMPYGYGFYG